MKKYTIEFDELNDTIDINEKYRISNKTKSDFLNHVIESNYVIQQVNSYNPADGSYYGQEVEVETNREDIWNDMCDLNKNHLIESFYYDFKNELTLIKE